MYYKAKNLIFIKVQHHLYMFFLLSDMEFFNGYIILISHNDVGANKVEIKIRIEITQLFMN